MSKTKKDTTSAFPTLPIKANKNDITNIFTESFMYNRFKLLLLNQYKWTGLEDTGILERNIEKYLYEDGLCVFFEDPMYGVMCLPGMGGGCNVYGEPTYYTVTGHNYQKQVNVEDCVVVENNKLKLPTRLANLYFTMKLYNLARSTDVNVIQLRLQTLFSTNDKNLLSVKKIIDEVEKYNWAIIKDSGLNVDEIVQAIQTGVKCYTRELRDEYNATMNEALTYFGINNSNTDKKERLITDEANANNQFIDSCDMMFLESREKAVEEINSKFGLSLKVERRIQREELKEGGSDELPNEKPDSE